MTFFIKQQEIDRLKVWLLYARPVDTKPAYLVAVRNNYKDIKERLMNYKLQSPHVGATEEECRVWYKSRRPEVMPYFNEV